MTRIIVNTKRFADVLSAVSAARSPRHDLLRLVVIAPHPDGVSVSATDSEIAMTVPVECEGSIDAPVAITPEKLLGLLREAREDSAEIEIADSMVRYRCGRAKCEIPAQGAEGFGSLLPKWVAEEFFTSERSLFERAAKFAAIPIDDSKQDKKFALTGVNFQKTPDGLLQVSGTDSHAVAVIPLGYSGGHDASPTKIDWNVPPKALKLACRAFTGETVDYVFSESDVTLRSGGVVASARLVSGKFPDVRRVIPVTHMGTKIRTTSSQFASLCRQALLFCNDADLWGHDVVVSAGDGDLSMRMGGTAAGSGDFVIPAETDGSAEFLWDPRLALQWLAALPEASPVEMSVVDEHSIIVLRSGNLTHGVMPKTAVPRE